MTIHDAAIIGGGPAGSALAALLAGAGRSVVLFEKEEAPHDKVCGEFISYEGAAYLSRLGLSLRSLGSEPIDSVSLARRGKPALARLPFPAHSLSRRAMDEALLGNAAKSGACVRRGLRVKRIGRHGDYWSAQSDHGEEVLARQVFLATGKHDLKDWRRSEGSQPDLIAFKMYWRLAPAQSTALKRSVELILFDGGYAGLQPVEDGRANLCLVVRKSVYKARYASWETLLDAMQEGNPLLAGRLSGAAPIFQRPLAISSIPYGYVARRSDGVWRLGDQAAVIPSFSGDGMSIALHSAHLAACWYCEGRTAETYQTALAAQLSAQVGRAAMLSQLLVRTGGQLAIRAAVSILAPSLTLAAKLTRIQSSALTVNGRS